MIIDKLIEGIVAKKNHTVIGLDPNDIPKEIIAKSDGIGAAIFEFNKGIIDATYDLVAIYKPQIAFYEKHGIDGMIAYKDTVRYIREKGLIALADVKRGDIGSTCEAYATAHFEGDFEADFITVNPYLGSDGIKPFLREDKGIFVLVKTSNQSSGEFQNIDIGGAKLYEQVARTISSLDQSIGSHGYKNTGVVFGATYGGEVLSTRSMLQENYFLVPGYGAQGGKAEDLVDFFNSDGLGAIINSSRGIIEAYKKLKGFDSSTYKEAARQATLDMREDINNCLAKAGKLKF